MSDRELPEWVTKMSDEEWETWKKESQEELDGLELNRSKKRSIPYTNCHVCNVRMLLTLCRYDEPHHYCPEHCPEHTWQTDYDWSPECARCGLSYRLYLEQLLEKHGIKY